MTNDAPRLSTCSFTAGRTSVALTIAPRRRAVATACNPATPAPSTNTRAGGIVPAAVIIIGMARANSAAASITALYPERFDCDERTSIDCARLILGTSSIAKASTPAAAYASTASRPPYGESIPTSAAPRRIAESSSVVGARTFSTRSASARSDAPSSTSRTPAPSYAASANPRAFAPRPARPRPLG